MWPLPTVLRRDCLHRSNTTREGARALKDLRKDQSRVILTADKGMVMVLLDKQVYINKVQDLLTDKDRYRLITGDPTTKHKNELIQILQTIKAQGKLGDITYYRHYLLNAVPKFYGLPRIHKHGTPISPIISSRGAFNY